jgi:hypothetical protein
MIQIFNNQLSPNNVRSLLDYFHVDDETVDARPDVRSKHPQWDSQWPKHIIKNVLDNILDYDYRVEEVVFFDTKISYSLHVDSGKIESSRKGHVIIFPLFVDGTGSTALFDNHWHLDSTRFSKVKIEPFEYNLPNRFESWTYIKDLRILLDQCLNSSETINDFVVDEEFISTLRYLIDARQDLKTSKVDGRCYDYTDVVGYDSQLKFNEHIHDQNFTHIPIETLHGLTLNSIIHWNVGSCFAFERTRLHSACSGHNKKIGLTIFTQRFD